VARARATGMALLIGIYFAIDDRFVLL